MRASGVRPRFSASLARHQHDGGGAVIDAGGVAGGHACRPCRRPGAAWPIASSVAPARMYSSWSTTMSPLRAGTVNGDDLVLEPAGLLRRLGLVLRGDGELVLLVAGDLPLRGDVLGRVAHVVAVEGIHQAVLDHRVDELRRRPSWCRRADGRHAGPCDIDSWPPATMISASPLAICCMPSATARRPEPQSWLRPQAVFSCGTPAFIAAWRAGFWPWPAVRIWPRMTSSTSPALDLARAPWPP